MNRKLLAFFVVGCVLIIARIVAGCGYLPGDETSDAELKYRATLLRCVDKAATLAESKACRKSVDADYFDGGKR